MLDPQPAATQMDPPRLTLKQKLYQPPECIGHRKLTSKKSAHTHKAHLLEIVLLGDDHLLTLAADVGSAVYGKLLRVAHGVKPGKVQV